MTRHFNIIYCTIILVILTSCAIQIGPQGGPKDILPPVIVKEEPKNKTVNFDKKIITLVFNEYVKLNNPNQEMIISPLVNPMPKISTRKKSVEIKFEEKLKENTTYTVQFGKSISDITENNVMADYSYIFSTGTKLDSVWLKGKVVEPLTNTFKENLKIMLHLSGNDSSLYKIKPEYYAKTIKSGDFEFYNLHNNKYRIYALDDENGNYLFDKGEKIAFINEEIDLSTNIKLPDLKLFKEKEDKIKVIDYGQKDINKFYLAFNSEFDSIRLTQIIKGEKEVINNKIKISESRDSVLFWLNTESDSIKIIIDMWGENHSNDTVKVFNDKKNVKIKPPSKLTIKPSISIYTSGKMYIEFNEPINLIDNSKIVLYNDTNKVAVIPTLNFTDSSYTKTLINFSFEYGKNYKIVFGKGAFLGFNRIVNDSIGIPIKTLKETELGLISVNIVIEKINIPVIVQLLDDKYSILRENKLQKSTKIIYNSIIPGKYYIRCILDSNNNSKWDTGNLLKVRQPEEIIYFKDDINLKANWEINDLIIKIQ